MDAIRKDIRIYRGDTYSQSITLCNCDLTIDKMYFTLKEKETDENIVFQKRLNEGIVPVPDKNNSFSININPEDTEDLKTDFKYVYDIEIIAGSFKRTIVVGTFELKVDITRKKDEV